MTIIVRGSDWQDEYVDAMNYEESKCTLSVFTEDCKIVYPLNNVIKYEIFKGLSPENREVFEQ